MLSENEGNPLMQAQDPQHFRAVFWAGEGILYSILLPQVAPFETLSGQVAGRTDICSPPFNFELQTKAPMIPTPFGF